jgi:hypothetical protein
MSQVWFPHQKGALYASAVHVHEANVRQASMAQLRYFSINEAI